MVLLSRSHQFPQFLCSIQDVSNYGVTKSASIDNARTLNHTYTKYAQYNIRWSHRIQCSSLYCELIILQAYLFGCISISYQSVKLAESKSTSNNPSTCCPKEWVLLGIKLTTYETVVIHSRQRDHISHSRVV